MVGPKEFDTSTVDPLFTRGAHIRRNSLTNIYNTVWMGWPTGIRYDGSGVLNACLGDTIKQISNIIAGSPKNYDTASAGGVNFDPNTFFLNALRLNDTLATNSLVLLTNPYGNQSTHNYAGSNFMPLPGSPALLKFTDPTTLDPFFSAGSYRGAFGLIDDWTAGWTNWKPDTVDYVNVSVNQISSNVPERFSLSQNYPNPFNPSTKIAFNVPVKGFVTLKVYDALGQEVATLVNQNLTVGEYAYDFNASILSSGIYFYTLKGENFVETKKMMLVK